MNDTSTDSTPSKAGFFQMKLNELKRIVAEGGGKNELAAYIVLCNGVNGRQHKRYCTHGAKSVMTRTGMGYRIAERAIAWLESHKFISKPGPDDPQHLGHGHGRNLQVRYVIADEEPDVAVSRQFLDGVRGGATPPLKHLLAEVNGTGAITRGQAITDAILLYAALMKEQDFNEHAGVNPEAWFQRFAHIEPGETTPDGDDLMTQAVHPVDGTNGVLVTVQEVPETSTFIRFMRHALGEPTAPEPDVAARFWHAVAELRRLRLAYRALVLWQGDPLNPKKRRHAEPLATLYINDPWARELDPFIQYEVNRAWWRSRSVDPYDDFDHKGDPQHQGTGRYRYIVRADIESTTMVVGQLRVRYWPANESIVMGRKIEQRRTARWQQDLSSLLRRQRDPSNPFTF